MKLQFSRTGQPFLPEETRKRRIARLGVGALLLQPGPAAGAERPLVLFSAGFDGTFAVKAGERTIKPDRATGTGHC